MVSEVNCNISLRCVPHLRETATTQLQPSTAIWKRCGNGADNSSNFSREARNLDFHVKFPTTCVLPIYNLSIAGIHHQKPLGKADLWAGALSTLLIVARGKGRKNCIEPTCKSPFLTEAISEDKEISSEALVKKRGRWRRLISLLAGDKEINRPTRIMKKTVLPHGPQVGGKGMPRIPRGCQSLGPQDHQGQKDADPGFYVPGGRGLMLFLAQLKCHTSRNSYGRVIASRQCLPITPRPPLGNIH